MLLLQGEENANKQPVGARRSRRSTKPVKYTESNSDEDDREERPEPDKAGKHSLAVKYCLLTTGFEKYFGKTPK